MLVRILWAGRADARLTPLVAIVGRDHLVGGGHVGSGVPGQVLHVEGGRLALRTDISYGCGPLLIHHLHALPLAGLQALF